MPEELRARAAALVGLSHVLHDRRPMDEGRETVGLERRDRAFARLLLATMLRRLGEIDALLDRCLERPLPAAATPVRDALRLGVAQLVFLDTPDHAAVNSTVALVRAQGWDGMAGLTNAILRRIARDGRAWFAALDGARLNTPDWLWETWRAGYGEERTRAIAAAHLVEPPLDIAVKSDPTGWAERLKGTVLPTDAIRVTEAGPVEELAGYGDGAWWVQDAAASLPVRLLGNVVGKHVIDLCAAPGGKTAQLIAAGARVTALDRSARRMRRLQENLTRLKMEAQTVVAEAEAWTPSERADALLLDAPCSATGTIRRHPDAPYLKQPSDIAVFNETQDRLLHAAVAMLPPGGLLIYAVCSLQAEEGPARVDALLQTGAPVERVPVTPDEIGRLTDAITADGDLRTFPFHLAEHGGMDAFFAARLRKL
ncbi:MAG TPA: transcription antitermination factor NusB [Magnetospirillaceae bacterium]